jgi:MEMO1 family protein
VLECYNTGMKPKTAVCLLLFLAALCTAAERRLVRDPVGFCWTPEAMGRLIACLEKRAGPIPALPATPVAAISPHDDFLYAGTVYFPLFRRLRVREAIIFGVTHGAVRKEIGDPEGVLLLDGHRQWIGPYGPVAVSSLRERIRAGLDPADFVVSDKAHELEHSIEALLPFLQHYNRTVAITPIMVTAMPLERMEALAGRLAGIIAAHLKERGLQLGRDAVILVSADANHYGPDFNNEFFGTGEPAHRAAVAQDRRFIRDYLEGPLRPERVRGLTGELWGATYRDVRNTYWCGKYSIPFGLLVADATARLSLGRLLTGRLLNYGDTCSLGVLPLSGDGFGITAPFSLQHWVSFFSADFRAGPPVRPVDERPVVDY